MAGGDWTRDGFPSRRTLRLGGAAVAAVALLMIGTAVGRATAGGGGNPPASVSTPPQVSSVVPSWAIGAATMNHAIPVGYAHTRDGAMNAARNYALALNATPLAVDPAATRAAYATVSTPAFAQRNAAELEQSLAGSAAIIAAAHQGHPTRGVPFVLTTRIDRYSTDEVTVTVWGGVVLAVDGVLAPQEVTSEETYTLRWLGDWQIDDLYEARGPGVKSLTEPAQTNAMPDELGASFNGVGNLAGK